MWVLVVPGEEAERTEIYGPYREQDTAYRAQDRWVADHPDETNDTFIYPLAPYRAARYGSTR